MNNQYIAPNRLKQRTSGKSKDHAAPAKARKAARIADPVPKTCCHRNGDTRIRKGNNVAKRFIINFRNLSGNTQRKKKLELDLGNDRLK